MDMRVVIVGASNTGRELADRLGSRYQVMILDNKIECLEELGTPLEPEEALAKLNTEPGVLCIRGDGTSRLVLKTFHDRSIQCALVAAAGTDEINLEVGKIGRGIGFDPIVAIQHEPANSEQYGEAQITAFDRAQLLADEVERSLRHKGAIVPRGIGLGRGELLEIRLVRTSPVLNRPLKDLAPHRWRVAAIFRGDSLIAPIGDTTLNVNDRVLLVGDPRILPTVAEYLRLGTPQFPQPYGPNVVTLEFDRGRRLSTPSRNSSPPIRNPLS